MRFHVTQMLMLALLLTLAACQVPLR